MDGFQIPNPTVSRTEKALHIWPNIRRAFVLNRNCEKVLLKQKSIQEAALEEKSAHYFGWGRLRGMLRCSIKGSQ